MQLDKLRQRQAKIVGLIITFVTFGSYLSTMAQGLILGDPTEYTVVSHILGIAHPPGYAFMTVLGKLFQTLVPIGTIAWRSHLVNVFAGTLIVLAIYNIILLITAKSKDTIQIMAATFGALAVAWAPNHWQHSIHANPHLITAAFLIVNIWLLLRWRSGMDSTDQSKAHILIFSFLTGIGAVHHPLTVFSFPAYALFILLVQPKILLDWKLLLKMIGCALLGLSLFAYYPIVSGQEPAMGPHTMNTIQGFLDHVLARGLSDSLPYYSLAEQPIRLTVYGSILRLQYGFIGAILALFGGLSMLRSKALRQPAALILVALGINYAFVISLKQQDIMAYIMGPNLLMAPLMAVGFWQLGRGLKDRFKFQPMVANGALLVLLAIVPFWTLAATLPHVTLRNFSEGDEHVEQTFDYFAGQGDGVVLLNNWEFMTPLWYAQLVDMRWPDPADVRPVFVSAADPWLPSVFNYLPGGPVYLNGYRREIVEAGFRLRPRSTFYQVVEPGDKTIPDELVQINSKGDGPELVGYLFEVTTVEGGDYVSLTLAMRLTEKTADFYAPSLKIANDSQELNLPFTTDSHLITPLWEPNEVIVERYDFAIPHDFPAGDYEAELTIVNLSQNTDSGLFADLGGLKILDNEGYQPETSDLLANFRQRVGLTSLTVRSGLQRRQAPWEAPLAVNRGDVVIVTPRWEALDSAEESYTIFVHLIDAGNVSYANLDYTPLGGAVPTHLWFPKWLPGQKMSDPYRLVIPEDIAPGSYQIEVGLYEMTSRRRLAMHDSLGNQVGDRYIAGTIEVR
ncbi:MAG: DUF2723 domain-containing protein [Anaerolineae bacterium]